MSHFKCPVCGQEHTILLQALLNSSQERPINFECPITKTVYQIWLSIRWYVPADFTKQEIQAGEEAEELRDLIWKQEEEIKKDGEDEQRS